MNDEQFTHYQRLLGESLSMEMGLDSAELCLRRALNYLDDAFARNEIGNRKALAAVESVLEDGLEALSERIVALAKGRGHAADSSEYQVEFARRHREERRESYRKAARAAGL